MNEQELLSAVVYGHKELTNRYKVKDEDGNEQEVIEYTPAIKLTLHTNSPVAGSRCSQMPTAEYKLSDGIRVIKVSGSEFQTPDGPIPRNFFIV